MVDVSPEVRANELTEVRRCGELTVLHVEVPVESDEEEVDAPLVGVRGVGVYTDLNTVRPDRALVQDMKPHSFSFAAARARSASGLRRLATSASNSLTRLFALLYSPIQ